MFFKKKKQKGDSKMDLFTQKKNDTKQDLKREEEKIKQLKKEVEQIEEQYGLEPEEQEERKQMDKATAEVGFKILVRQLHDVELQIKSGKILDIDESRRDKLPTINYMVNQAEAIKLRIKEYIDALNAASYQEEDIQKLRTSALEGRNNYVYFTV